MKYETIRSRSLNKIFDDSARKAPTRIPAGPTDQVKALLQVEPAEYDYNASFMLATASGWSYSDTRTLAHSMNLIGITDNTCDMINFVNNSIFVESTAYFVQSSDKNLGILCFRGTEANVLSWLTNTTVEVDPFGPIGHLHGGFYRNVIAEWLFIERLLRRFVADMPEESTWPLGLPPKALYITGHSLGGAMAAIAAAQLFLGPPFGHDKTDNEVDPDENLRMYRRMQRGVLRGVYTFGQPMIGDPPFAAWADDTFGDRVFRHVYGLDVVTRMPPVTTGDFEHFGREYRSTPSGWMMESEPVTQALTALGSAAIGILAYITQQLPLFRRLRLPFSAWDHSPLNYMRASRAHDPRPELL